MCGNEQVVVFTPKNVQFQSINFFIKVSDEEKFLLFQDDEINGKSVMSYWYMLDARMWIRDNIASN